jgi:hypothetical protein
VYHKGNNRLSWKFDAPAIDPRELL